MCVIIQFVTRRDSLQFIIFNHIMFDFYVVHCERFQSSYVTDTMKSACLLTFYIGLLMVSKLQQKCLLVLA